MTSPDIRAQAVLCYTHAMYASHACDTLLAKMWADLGSVASQLADDIAAAQAVEDDLKALREKQTVPA